MDENYSETSSTSSDSDQQIYLIKKSFPLYLFLLIHIRIQIRYWKNPKRNISQIRVGETRDEKAS